MLQTVAARVTQSKQTGKTIRKYWKISRWVNLRYFHSYFWYIILSLKFSVYIWYYFLFIHFLFISHPWVWVSGTYVFRVKIEGQCACSMDSTNIYIWRKYFEFELSIQTDWNSIFNAIIGTKGRIYSLFTLKTSRSLFIFNGRIATFSWREQTKGCDMKSQCLLWWLCHRDFTQPLA